MRGLSTAGRAVRLERIACLVSGVAGPWGSVAHSWFAGRSSRCCHRPGRRSGPGWSGLLLEHGQGPAPAGELAGDGDVGHDVALVPGSEGVPAVVQPPVALVAAGAGCR